MGDCETFDNATVVTWAVVGLVDGYSSSVAEDIVSRFIGENIDITIEEVEDPTVCDIGEFNYGGDCEICPSNTYQELDGSSSCTSCPYDSVTFYDGARCQEQCHTGNYADGFVSLQISLDPCAFWNIIHVIRHICSSHFLPDEICYVADGFYELSMENAISEELLSELFGPEICDTNVSNERLIKLLFVSFLAFQKAIIPFIVFRVFGFVIQNLKIMSTQSIYSICA